MPANVSCACNVSSLLALSTACAQIALWRRQFPELRLTTNLSPRDVEHADLADTVQRALTRHGLPPASLELEVSESLLCGDLHNVAPGLRDLRNLGVGISLDDFGTSYSSLANLPRYGISRIKIDRSFVKNIQSQSSHPVINAIAGVARGFDIQLTAEGVERGSPEATGAASGMMSTTTNNVTQVRGGSSRAVTTFWAAW